MAVNAHATRRRSPLGSALTPYLFLAPAAAYLVIFQGIPLVREGWLSLTRTSLLSPQINEWVGFGNFAEIFASPDFRQVLVTTLLYVVVCVAAPSASVSPSRCC